MLLQHDLEPRLRKAVLASSLVSNRLFDALAARDDAAGLVRRWALQQYFMSISLSPCFAALYVRAPFRQWQERGDLLALAVEEAWTSATDNHGALFLRFIASIGLCRHDLDRAVATAVTVRAAETRLAICLGTSGYSLTAATLALAFANEYANIHVFARLRGLVRGAFAGADLAYFDAHLAEEGSHMRSLTRFAHAVAPGAVDADEAISATRELLDVRAAFFDDVADGGQPSILVERGDHPDVLAA